MEKRGSQTLTAFFLIIIAVVAVTSIILIIKNRNIEDLQVRFNCIKDIKIEILNTCYEGNLLKIEIKNKDDIILGDFFLISLYFSNQTSETIPTPYNTYIMPYETKTITVPYYKGLEKIRVIPRIENKNYLCSEFAPEYENINECKNEKDSS